MKILILKQMCRIMGGYSCYGPCLLLEFGKLDVGALGLHLGWEGCALHRQCLCRYLSWLTVPPRHISYIIAPRSGHSLLSVLAVKPHSDVIADIVLMLVWLLPPVLPTKAVCMSLVHCLVETAADVTTSSGCDLNWRVTAWKACVKMFVSSSAAMKLMKEALAASC